MASTGVSSTAVMLILTLAFLYGSKAALISIIPDHIELTTSVVDISCRLDAKENASSVNLIQVFKNKEMPIASLNKSDVNLTADYKNFPGMKVSGSIETVAGESYLDVSLPYPWTNESGNFTCRVAYTDQTSQVVEHTATGNVTNEDGDMKNMRRATSMLLDRVRNTKAVVDNYDKIESDNLKATKSVKASVEDRWNSLMAAQQQVQDHFNSITQEINDITKRKQALSEKESYVCAFTARFNQHDDRRLQVNRPIALSDMVLQIGEGYDKTTGVFTAPVKGLYVFYFILETSSKTGMDVEIRKGTESIARIESYDDSWNHQTGGSAVIMLLKGEQVSVVPILLLDPNNGVQASTFFIGHLIKQM